MTEEEAKSKWCPFARCEGAFAYGNPTRNRVLHVETGEEGRRIGAETRWPEEGFCIASACMAWRWNSPEIERRWTSEGDPSPGSDWERDPEAKPKADERFAKVFWRRNPNGYCGLAGAPQ